MQILTLLLEILVWVASADPLTRNFFFFFFFFEEEEV